jgi:hypothetical protein
MHRALASPAGTGQSSVMAKSTKKKMPVGKPKDVRAKGKASPKADSKMDSPFGKGKGC